MKVRSDGDAELPFENNYYFVPDLEDPGLLPKDSICWFVQRKEAAELKEKGLPPYLKLMEESMMFLRH